MPKTLKCSVFVALMAAPLSSMAYWGCPPPPPPGWHGGWGCYGGYAVGAGLVGGLLGAALYDAVRPTRTVVQQQPVAVQQTAARVQSVWVEGRYIDQVQPNGTSVRVWNPGHYEQRSY